MEIKLIVIRTKHLERLVDFYSLLGMQFEYHQHGNSPFHYSALVGNTVVEIYPLTKEQSEADKNLRLGFSVDDFESTLSHLKNNNISFSEPNSTEFGHFVVLSDPDGRKVELYRK